MNMEIQQTPVENKGETVRTNNLFLTHAIAYYNLGASLEHMTNLNEAIESYQVALKIAESTLGEEHALSRTIRDNMIKAEEKKRSN